ncbi:acyltransferase domain-containing protein [bacterium]|nr:acyltransferase domain-containing protein [bacterium]
MRSLALTSIGLEKFDPSASDAVVIYIAKGWEYESFDQAWSALDKLLSENDFVTIASGEKWFTVTGKLDQASYAILDSKNENAECLFFKCDGNNSEDIVATICKAAQALHTKIMPENSIWNDVEIAEARPWISPCEPEDPPTRHALVKAGALSLHMTESVIAKEAIAMPFASELFLFGAQSSGELLENLRLIRDLLERDPKKKMSDLAYTLNVLFAPFKSSWRAALVCENIEQLNESLITLILKLEAGEEFYSDPYGGIFLANEKTSIKGKMAFVLPGLGSAYTNMLKDLSMHFPLVREVFDYVDLVTKNFGSSDIPSLRIFPLVKGKSDSSSLISADYAVLAVLLAEYSLFRLFTKLGLAPNAFMGFSTGEFGVYVMNGSVDVLVAASIFYEQSTHVHRSFPKQEKESLKTVSIFSSRDSVMKIAKTANATIHLTADLTDKHVIITGKNADMEKLMEQLELESIGFSVAPIAIPYHTDLVSKAVDEEQLKKSFSSCNFQKAQIESWLCSLEGKGPDEPDLIEEALLGLLRRPIAFRNTIKDMFESGITTFVELGPQGILTYQIKDILQGKKHLGIASNLAGKSGITQINFLLAELFTHGYGTNFDLSHLYEHRDPKSVLEQAQAHNVEYDCYSDYANSPESSDKMVREFLAATNKIHSEFNQTNLEIIHAYLQGLSQNKVPVVFLDTEPDMSKNAVVAFTDQFIDLTLSADSSWLTELEIQDYNKNCRHDQRRKSWLLGRLAAKSAVSELASKIYGQKIDLNQIEIFNADNSAPYCRVSNSKMKAPLISIAHSHNAACAVAVKSDSNLTCGIDIEWMEQENKTFEELKHWTKREAGFKSFTMPSESPFQASYFQVSDYLIALVLQPLTARLDGAKSRE